MLNTSSEINLNDEDITPYLVWKNYREFRRSIMAQAKLEQEIGIDLFGFGERSPAERLSKVERWFLVQSFHSLEETCQDALQAFQFVMRSIPVEILTDVSALEQALSDRVPDFDPEVKDAVLTALRSYGNLRAWAQVVQDILSLRIDSCRLGRRVLLTQKHLPKKEVFSILERILILQDSLDPELKHLPRLEVDDRERVKAKWAAKLDSAYKNMEMAREEGEPCFLAIAEHRLRSRHLCLLHPDIAVDLGINCCEHSEPIPLLLCIAGPIGVGICVIALVAAVSSHNVE